ncbi:aldo/keto reductase [Deinococcus radiophilus]|uniref:aldo/keto reductase n=1 Tax=Deinococcus radiophilus TaxID=32062 RepID=UPI0036181586
MGLPTDETQIAEVLELVPQLGINLIDTADAYGPHLSEELIRRTLHPYDTVVVATKGDRCALAPASGGPWVSRIICGSVPNCHAAVWE